MSTHKRLLSGLGLSISFFLTLACGQTSTSTPTDQIATREPASIAGRWRAVLTSPGGELPFTFEITDHDGTLAATIWNSDERVSTSSVERSGSEVVLRFAGYDSEITAELSDDGEHLQGTWRKTAAERDSRLPFAAHRGDERRFLPLAEAGLEPGADTLDSIDGVWATRFRDTEAEPDEEDEPARGELTSQGSRVLGTFLTPTGDYRYLDGSYEDGLLRLSTFDGAHAFLFVARAQPDGQLVGDFWSRDTYHATWTARPATAEEELLPDAWSQVGLTNDEGRLAFEFPNLDGQPLSLADARFTDKVVLVNIFGSWCPNCNDEAPLLAEWHRRYGAQGLELVGLAYEFTGDVERDRQQVRRFAERYDIEYPLLLAGISDKKAASETLPDLSAVLAYPTSIFIGRDGKVRRIHSGFAGPGTGEHHERLVAEIEGLIEELLAESA